MLNLVHACFGNENKYIIDQSNPACSTRQEYARYVRMSVFIRHKNDDLYLLGVHIVHVLFVDNDVPYVRKRTGSSSQTRLVQSVG
jgi:hypothetical protein